MICQRGESFRLAAGTGRVRAGTNKTVVQTGSYRSVESLMIRVLLAFAI